MKKNYLDAIGDDFGAIGDEFGAEGSQDLKMVSLPYILTIENTTTSTIADVPIFNSAVYCRNTASLPAGLTFTVARFNSYDAFLWQLSIKPITVGRTYWTSASASQVQDITFVVKNKLADGRLQETPINPEFNKFANQDTVNDDFTPYIVDSNTELIISEILASQTLKIRFYYSETVDVKRMLSGRGAVQQSSVGHAQGLVVSGS